MEFTVYILFSDKLGKYYVGQTRDLNSRLSRHNQGRERFTRTGCPWKLIHSIYCNSRSEAMILEKKIKNLGAKRYLVSLE
ncbi:GIY-YIG nuclease family protein [Algoriphagus machipongonensis]|uniref:Excinuclease ABC subunit C n=1 Tax=Algoriphagus machipongonensis TaxID=388413 RepID=A3I014_9BACT|nr:GIY-YIG nuclease family protein [Algoriphagus machipongonensis]EAZ80850.1 excinuclease ABC subunit C [Algoriphagus machipongonensis]